MIEQWQTLLAKLEVLEPHQEREIWTEEELNDSTTWATATQTVELTSSLDCT
jgi:hypothetical protein